MLLALTGGQKLGIALVAAAFVVFALVSSFVMPRRNANFPGKRLPLFVLTAILFFVGMMTAMVTLAKESEEEGEAAPPTETGTSSRPPQSGPATTGAAKPKGDPTAGKQVFESAGCTSCHTLDAAGSHGTVGPNLDQAKPPYALIITRVTNGKPPMPSFKGQLSQTQIQDVAAFVFTSTH